MWRDVSGTVGGGRNDRSNGSRIVVSSDSNKGKKRELEIEPGDDESSSKRYLSSSLNQSKTKTNEV